MKNEFLLLFLALCGRGAVLNDSVLWDRAKSVASSSFSKILKVSVQVRQFTINHVGGVKTIRGAIRLIRRQPANHHQMINGGSTDRRRPSTKVSKVTHFHCQCSLEKRKKLRPPRPSVLSSFLFDSCRASKSCAAAAAAAAAGEEEERALSAPPHRALLSRFVKLVAHSASGDYFNSF